MNHDDNRRNRSTLAAAAPRRVGRSVLGVLGVYTLLISVSACGGNSSGAAAPDTAPPTTQRPAESVATTAPTTSSTTQPAPPTTQQPAESVATTAPTTSSTTQPAPPTTIQVVASNYAFSGMPSTIVAGSKISLTTAEGAEPHEIVVKRVKDSDSRSIEELQAEGASPPKLELGHALWIIALPGETDSVVRFGDTLGPGRYLYFCNINQPGGTSHNSLGMSGWVSVE